MKRRKIGYRWEEMKLLAARYRKQGIDKKEKLTGNLFEI